MDRRLFLKTAASVAASTLAAGKVKASDFKSRNLEFVKAKKLPQPIRKIKDTKGNEMIVCLNMLCSCKEFQITIYEEMATEPCPGCGRKYTATLKNGMFRISEIKNKKA